MNEAADHEAPPEKLVDLSTMYPLVISGVIILVILVWNGWLLIQESRWQGGDARAAAVQHLQCRQFANAGGQLGELGVGAPQLAQNCRTTRGFDA